MDIIDLVVEESIQFKTSNVEITIHALDEQMTYKISIVKL